MPNGNLERMLYSYNNYLNLLQRINIVLDVASALEYLHHHHPQVALHCDLKPSNVLLDELSLRQWVCEAHPSALLEIVDCNLLKDAFGNEKSSEDLISMSQCISSILELGILCSMDSPKERLAMIEVVPRLHKIKAVYLTTFPNDSNMP